MMRQLIKWPSVLTLLTATAFASMARATPVYLSLESRFPSGHHPRQYLESRTRNVQFQQWWRVETFDKAYGWIPEDHLLTPVKLATQVIFSEDTPGRSQKQIDALSSTLLKKDQAALVLETSGSWARVQPLPASQHASTWAPLSALRADFEAPSLKAYVPDGTLVYVLPGLHARIHERIRSARFVNVVKESQDWIEIRFGRTGHGFVRAADAITLAKLKEDRVRPLFALVPLRSAPLPFADIVRTIGPESDLKVIASDTLRWGQARVPELGEMWWPITEESEDERSSGGRERISNRALFKRRIFDMASSPAVPSLKFASARGVFRTVDGKEWTRIPLFKDANYPIAVAGGGSVFVGPYVSDDHGETFQQWIRWDSLVATLRRQAKASASGLQILAIKPQDASGRSTILSLNAGLAKPLLLITDDQGVSWRLAQ
jgi:hypothetical protein